jgi:multidrug transporter EmrE-like cation transporter
MMIQIFILAFFAVILSGISQILLKMGAGSMKRSHYFPDYLRPYFNKYSLTGYLLLLCVTVISVYILEEMPLKLFFPFFISLNMIAVVILSNFVLKEPLTSRKLIAVGIIIGGILIFNL